MKFNLVMALVVTAVVGIASSASALPTQRSTMKFYSDATFTHQVGSLIEITRSGGSGTLVGQASEYVVEVFEPCPGYSSFELHCRVDGVETYCPVNICGTYDACQ